MKSMTKIVIASVLFIILVVSFLIGRKLVGSNLFSSVNNKNTSNSQLNKTQNSLENNYQNDSAISEKIEYSVGTVNAKIWTDDYNRRKMKIGIPVTNTGNTVLYLSSPSIDIITKDDRIVDVFDYIDIIPKVIKPGETAYCFTEQGFDCEETENLKAVLHFDAKKATVPYIRYKVSDIQMKTEYGRPYIIGFVENNTKNDDSLAYIEVNYFDKDGKIIGNQTAHISGTLYAGEKRGFETSIYGCTIDPSEVSRYEIYAYPLQFQF